MAKRSYIEISPLHRNRYVKHEVLGLSIDDIATEDNVTPATVIKSIETVKIQKHFLGLESLEASEAAIVIDMRPLKQAAIERGLTAEKKIYIEHGEGAGEVIAVEPDHEIQLAAVDRLTEMTKTVMARHIKGNSQTVNVNTGIGITNTFTSFEDRLREVKKKMEPAVELPPANVIDVAPEKVESGNPT